MLADYTSEALKRARYTRIENQTAYQGEVPGWPGITATGANLEECRENLEKVVRGWLVVQLKRGFAIPPLG